MSEESRHLDMLGIADYVVGGVALVAGLCPFLHVGMGMTMVFSPQSLGPNHPPEIMGWMFVVTGLVVIAAFWTLGVLLLLKGRFMRGRRRYLYCLVVSGAACAFTPLGTVLGVISIIVLTRPEAKRLFDTPAAPAEVMARD